VENPQQEFEMVYEQLSLIAKELEKEAGNPDKDPQSWVIRNKSGKIFYLTRDHLLDCVYVTRRHPSALESWTFINKKGPYVYQDKEFFLEARADYIREPFNKPVDSHLYLRGKYREKRSTSETREKENILFGKTDELLKELSGRLEIIDSDAMVEKVIEIVPYEKEKAEMLIGAPPPTPRRESFDTEPPMVQTKS
jgi:hypothetical protein